jgi:taurine transport system substrate-binding protein
MTMKLSPTIRRAAAALSYAVLFAFASAPSAQAQDKPLEVQEITYGGSAWLSHYPVWVGIEKGIFKAHGLDVKWENFGTSSSRMSALVSDQIQFGGVGSISAIALMATGFQGFYILGAPDSYATVEGIIALKDIKSPADLKGKKIGVPFASSAHVLVLDVLEQAGLNAEQDVTLINIPAGDTPSTFNSGQVDAVSTWAPSFNMLRAQENAHVLLDDTQFSLYKSYGLGPGPDALVGSKSFVDENPNASSAFLEAFFESSKFINDNPDEAADILVKLTSLPLADQKTVLKDITWSPITEQQAIMAPEGNFTVGLQSLADLLVKFKQIDTAPKVGDWINGKAVQ